LQLIGAIESWFWSDFWIRDNAKAWPEQKRTQDRTGWCKK